MVNTKISALPAAGTITGTEVVPVVQGGATKAATITQLLALITAGAPGNLDTFFEVATQMGLDETTVTTLQALVAGKADTTSVAATYSTLLTPASSYTWNTDGTIATETVGGVTTTFAWNADGTLHTETRNGVTRTYTYNGTGTLASVA